MKTKTKTGHIAIRAIETVTKTGHTPLRCKECLWIHEVDGVNSFMGVALCPLHAAAPELLEACKAALFELSGINNGNECRQLAQAIAKAEGK